MDGVGQSTDLIEAVVVQTSVLALNATTEAARATEDVVRAVERVVERARTVAEQSERASRSRIAPHRWRLTARGVVLMRSPRDPAHPRAERRW